MCDDPQSNTECVFVCVCVCARACACVSAAPQTRTQQEKQISGEHTPLDAARQMVAVLIVTSLLSSEENQTGVFIRAKKIP